MAKKLCLIFKKRFLDRVTGTRFTLYLKQPKKKSIYIYIYEQWLSRHLTTGNKAQRSLSEKKQMREALIMPDLNALTEFSGCKMRKGNVGKTQWVP